MAINLPYPSLVFVPLDKLSAEEMNEIVANYTELAGAFPISASNIASNAVTTNKIPDGAITADKIDWTTVSGDDWPAMTVATSNKNVNASSWYNQHIYTIPADGVYLIAFSQRITTNTEAGYDFCVNITGSIHGDLQTAYNGGSSYIGYMQPIAIGIFTLTASEIITARSKGGASTGGAAQTVNGRFTVCRLR